MDAIRTASWNPIQTLRSHTLKTEYISTVLYYSEYKKQEIKEYDSKITFLKGVKSCSKFGHIMNED